MQLYWLSDNVGVSDQLYPENLFELSRLGIKSVICNRPDGESGPDQPTAHAVMLATEKLGMQFVFHPVQSNFQSNEDAAKMAEHLNKLPKPVVAYCRSGGRSTALIGLTQQLQLINLQGLE
tara:strand:+ start:1605 stop:1967 length:363 start_codon:yes stop_codon:yes gene_type:complete